MIKLAREALIDEVVSENRGYQRKKANALREGLRNRKMKPSHRVAPYTIRPPKSTLRPLKGSSW